MHGQPIRFSADRMGMGKNWTVPLRILDIHDFMSDMALLHTKNKAVSLKVANTLMSIPKKRQFLANFRVIYI